MIGHVLDLSGQATVAAAGNGKGEAPVANGDVDLLATHLCEIRSPRDECEGGSILDDGDASGRKRDVAGVPATRPRCH